MPALHMPAEWEQHEATWIVWPHRRSDWPGKFALIPWVYGEIIRHLLGSENIRIAVQDAEEEQQARRLLKKVRLDSSGIEFHHLQTDRGWIRDFGPTFVHSDAAALHAVKWQFNAWAKYPQWHCDDAAGLQIAEKFAAQCWMPECRGRRIVLEGGSIDVNGNGLLLTTEECLLSTEQQRNPDLSRTDYEKAFKDYLGVHSVVWLGAGIAGDDTHGHVDDIARFVNPHTVVTVITETASDVNYRPLQENLERLRGVPGLEVVRLPMPEPVFFGGQRLPASYANFYVCNERVLVPTFNDERDRVALGRLAELFPTRCTVGIHALDLVWGLGTLHCLTQQQPAVQHLG